MHGDVCSWNHGLKLPDQHALILKVKQYYILYLIDQPDLQVELLI